MINENLFYFLRDQNSYISNIVEIFHPFTYVYTIFDPDFRNESNYINGLSLYAENMIPSLKNKIERFYEKKL